MRIVLGALLVVCACSKKDDYPIGGGGDGGNGPDSAIHDAASHDSPTAGDAPGDSTPSDAALPGDGPLPIDAALLNGRVCLAADPRQLTSCATTGAGGLTVRLGSSTAVTADDGRFTIGTSTGTWSVTGPNIVTSFMVFSDFQIPAITTATFTAMKTANNVTILPGQGSLMVNVIKNGNGYAGTTAVTSPLSTYEAFYDGASTTTWTQTSAGTHGDAWMAGINVGSTVVTVTAPTTPPSTASSASQPISDGAITYVTVVFP